MLSGFYELIIVSFFLSIIGCGEYSVTIRFMTTLLEKSNSSVQLFEEV